MQSYLQYQRFGRKVQAQYDRDSQKAEALARGNATPFSHQYDGQESSAGDLEAQNHHRPSSIDSVSEVPEPTEKLPAEADDVEPEEAREREREREHGEHGAEMGTRATRQDTRTSQASFGTRLGTVFTGVEVRRMTPEIARTRSKATAKSKRSHTDGSGEKDEKAEMDKVFVVNYEGDNDELNPHNWSHLKRLGATAMIASIGFMVGFASSIDSAALTQAAEEFGVSEVVESLATGLYLVGFGFGGLLAGPISETVGRNPVYLVTMLLYMIFIMASGLAPNIGAQLAFRFLAGLFGSTPLTCAGGSISDLYSPLERVWAFPMFANAAFMGPIFGPVVGGFVGQSSLVSWRWCEWITLILSGAVWIAIILFQPETYAPMLLKYKAKHMRRITGDERFVSEIEIRAESLPKRLLHALYRPFIITAQEPIVILFALYLTVIYIILFTFLDGYTYIFGETYGFSEGLVGLSFIGIAIGLCFASLLIPYIYSRALHQSNHGATKLVPEFRLWFAMFGAPAVPISMFWMGWTAYPHISYWSPLLASVLFGYGILCIFISTYQYIIDSFEMYAASALASVTLIRYVAAGGMVEVGIPFYENLGVHWTLTILGAISAVMVPVPYVFYVYGPKLRALSKHAPQD